MRKLNNNTHNKVHGLFDKALDKTYKKPGNLHWLKFNSLYSPIIFHNF